MKKIKIKKGGERLIYVLNTPILTSHGVFVFKKISVEKAKRILRRNKFISAVGHQGTAEILTSLLELEIPFSRTPIKMKIGDRAVVFRLQTRLPEGKVLSKEELEQLPFELGLLVRVV